MSSIIKGQRIRSESTLEIENTNTEFIVQEGEESLTPGSEEQKEEMKRKLEKAKSKSSRIIQEAEEEALARATVIIKEGQDRIKMEVAIALETAQAEGYQAGYEKGQEEAQSLVDEGKQIVLDAQREKQQLLDSTEPEIIEMIIKICGKLIDEEINYNKDTILLLIRQALGHVSSDTSEISIKVSDEDYDHVLNNTESITKGSISKEHIEIKKDASLSKGVCIIETPFGSVESNVDKAFSEIKQQMRLIYNKK